MRAEHFRRQKARWFNVGWRTRWLAILASVLALACVFDWYASQHRHAVPSLQTISNSNSGASAPTEPLLDSKGILPLAVHAERSRKVLYPYSVIPGGVQSVEELKNAIAKDPVASAEYAGFRLEHARIIRLDRERSMHVSYRLGDRVYWTKGELTLAKGETLITDGTQTARTRCGNMIAESIVAQVSPDEPSALELNTPIPAPYTPDALGSDNRSPEIAQAAYSNVPLAYPNLAPAYPNLPLTYPNVLPAEGSSYSGGEIEPGVFLHFGPAGPMPYPVVPAPSPVVKTPESGTAIFLLTALLALFLIQRRKRNDAPKNAV